MANNERYESVDCLRGLALAGMFLVGSKSPFPQLRHGTWFQVTAADLVYPLFLILVGLSMSISTERALARGQGRGEILKRLLRRFGILFLLGVVLSSISARAFQFNLGTFQSIAIAAVGSLPAVFLTSRLKVGYFVLVWVVTLAATILFAAPDSAWLPQYNFPERLDLMLLGKFRGVEGLFSSVAAAAFVTMGLLLGQWLQKLSAREWLKQLCLLSISCYALGNIAEHAEVYPVLPIPSVSRILSGSFVLLTLAVLLPLIGLVVSLLRDRSAPGLLSPLKVLGENPLAVYCGVKLFQDLLLRVRWFSPPDQLGDLLVVYVGQQVGEPWAALTLPVLKLSIAFVLATFLHRKRWRIRI